LNKFIANTGLCSRREADEYIKAGDVTINDVVHTEMGVRVKPGDVVKYKGAEIKPQSKTYIIMNKPKDFVTTVDDPNAKRTVIDLVEGKIHQRVYPVGRLDRNTTGVLLLTNDGELTKVLTHPKHNKKKIYHVQLDKVLEKEDMDKISEGFELEDGFISADEISYVHDEDKRQIGIEIHSGKNRIIRRLFHHLDYKVMKLDRVYFAGLTKKGLSRGQWRFLNSKEVAALKMSAYE
jgi:23S rRNA pseudouridine2605 synthase